jgi:hypothetical protein
MKQLDYLIPKSIMKMMNLDRFDFELKIDTTSANNDWPMIKILVDSEVVFDEQIESSRVIKYQGNCVDKEFILLDIEFYGKNENHTVVDENGNIIENQGCVIKSLKINDVDVVSTQIIYNLGHYYFYLSEQKRQYFEKHGYATDRSHSLSMFENGTWKMKLKTPILTELVKYKAFYEAHEQWPDDKFMRLMYNNIIELENLDPAELKVFTELEKEWIESHNRG